MTIHVPKAATGRLLEMLQFTVEGNSDAEGIVNDLRAKLGEAEARRDEADEEVKRLTAEVGRLQQLECAKELTELRAYMRKLEPDYLNCCIELGDRKEKVERQERLIKVLMSRLEGKKP